MPTDLHPLQAAAAPPGPPATLDLATFSYEDRRVILPAVSDAMVLCGCWLLDRKTVSIHQTEFLFELQLRSIMELYAALIGAGLELTRASHLDLTGLCTLRKHDPHPSSFSTIVTVRLEVSFLEELAEPALLYRGAGLA